MSYRHGKSPKCEEPADTWMGKMMAKIKDSKVAKMTRDMRENPWFYSVLMPSLIVTLSALLVLASLIAAQFRDPILVDPPCSQRCKNLGATQYRIKVEKFSPLRVRKLESNCVCQFEDGRQMNLADGEWESIDE